MKLQHAFKPELELDQDVVLTCWHLQKKMSCCSKGKKWSGGNFSCQLNGIITTQTLFFPDG